MAKAHAGLPVAYDDVLAARETIGDRLHRTPTFSSATLSGRIGAPAALKAELFQRTGSFKPRGMLNVLAHLSDEEKAPRRDHHLGRERGAVARLLLRARGHRLPGGHVAGRERGQARGDARVRRRGRPRGDQPRARHSSGWRSSASKTGRVFVHSFDDPHLIAGHGTLALELLEDVPDVATVVVPIGGGGLISGIATAVKGRAPEVRIVGVEPELSPAMHVALEAGEPIAGRAAARSPTGSTPPLPARTRSRSAASSWTRWSSFPRSEIRAAMRFVYERAKLACEPAGAVSTAALLAGKIDLDPAGTTVAVVSGGNVAPQTAVAILGEE